MGIKKIIEDIVVSIIVPLFNYEQYIGMCIQSIKNQTYKKWELIIVDDCSIDNSYQIAKKEENNKIKVIRLDKNKGYSAAKNEAIRNSKGKYIVPLDADDMLTKNSLKDRINAIVKYDVDFVHGNAININKKTTLKEAYKMDFKKAKKLNPRIHAQGVMYKREIHIKYGLYDEDLRARADKEMWIRLFGKKDGQKNMVTKKKIKNIVAYYRIHSNAMHVKRSKNNKLQKKLTKQLEKAIEKRRKGINKNNTLFLEK